jgi:ATPase subunit of ABC transporter with duplicated ATPase domains
MSTPIAVEVNCQTGEVTERPLTEEELAQREADAAAAAAAEAERMAEEAQKAEARAAAIDHAKSLGFTDEMIAVMYPQL